MMKWSECYMYQLSDEYVILLVNVIQAIQAASNMQNAQIQMILIAKYHPGSSCSKRH